MPTNETIRRAELAVIKAAEQMDDAGPSTDLNTWNADDVIVAVRKLRKLKQENRTRGDRS